MLYITTYNTSSKADRTARLKTTSASFQLLLSFFSDEYQRRRQRFGAVTILRISNTSILVLAWTHTIPMRHHQHALWYIYTSAKREHKEAHAI